MVCVGLVGVALVPTWPSGSSGVDSGPIDAATDMGSSSPRGERNNEAVITAHAPMARPAVIDNCALCHREPLPETLPRERWGRMLDYMDQMIVDYDLGHLLSASDQEVVEQYYTSNAPEALAVLPVIETMSTIGFFGQRFGSVGEPVSPSRPAAIAQVSAVDLNRDGAVDVLACDLAEDAITWSWRDDGGQWRERVLAHGLTPVHVEAVELTGDTHLDLVVACIGSFPPSEERVGRVVILENQGDETFTERIILEDVPRIADAQPIDVDDDGDTDFIVAMFGGWKTGSLGWLENVGGGDANGYVLHEIEAVNGASHVPVVDLNGDGRLDFVALISQHHERVTGYVNRGYGLFEAVPIFQADHPLFGSSSIRLVDLDRDGDVDVLHTNGDALDNDAFPKPYHGVQWHENLGGLRFQTHRLTDFYGAFAVHAADFDGDDDLDIVAASNMSLWEDRRRASMILLENDGTQNFEVQKITTSPIKFGCLDVVDINGDDRPDILTGGLHVMPPFERMARLSIWTNEGPRRLGSAEP